MSDMPPPPPDDSGWSSNQPPQPPPPPGPASHSIQAMTGWATLGTGGKAELASPGSRLGARIIDTVIIGVVGLILFVVLSGSTGAFDSATTDEEVAATVGAGIAAFVIAAAGFAVAGAAYEVTMIALKGQTLGKMATSIKVVRADDGLAPGWGKSIGRWIIPIMFAFIPVVGGLLTLLVYVSLTWDRARQGWHDKAAATLVIKV